MITLSAGIDTRPRSETLFWICPYLDLSSFRLLTTKYLDDIHESTDIKWGKPNQTNLTKTVLEADLLFPAAKLTTYAQLTQSTCSHSNIQIHS